MIIFLHLNSLLTDEDSLLAEKTHNIFPQIDIL